MRLARGAFFLPFCFLTVVVAGENQNLTVEEAVRMAQAQNPEIAIARKKIQAANGGVIEARAGYLPSLVSTGLFRERKHERDSQLRNEDYNASVRLVETLYSGGAVPSQLGIARLNLEKQNLELQAVINRVSMDVRIAFNELLLNRSKVRVHEQSVSVLQEELTTQQQRLSAGTVSQLNVGRAQVALANEQPVLVDTQTELKNSELRLEELLGENRSKNNGKYEAGGQLQYRPLHPDLNECLARADTERPEIRMRQIQVEIEDLQAELDRSQQRPQVEAFTGYEIYNERDPTLGAEFNYGYVVGVNAKWHIFDGYATKGKLIATQARREAAVQDLEATKMSVASEVRSAFLDLDQADRTLESETKNVQTADESLEIAKGNAAAGLGTQLDVLQAASDVTRTRTTRLSAIYLHNAAVARLARACAVSPDVLESSSKLSANKTPGNESLTGKAVNVGQPPSKLSQR